MPAFLIAAIVALLGGGTSVAAENALPGEALYAMKTEVNERVVSALSFGKDAKAEWEARRAERRLEEVATLANEGELKTDVSVRIRANFKAHADRVQARVEALTAAGDTDKAADLASRFEGSLRAHDRILERLKERANEEKQTEESDALNDIAQANADALAETEDGREKLERGIEDADGRAERKQPAEGKIGAAENVLAAAARFIETKKGKATDESVNAAEDALNAAKSLLDEAKAKLAAGTYGEAFVLGNKAIRAAQEAKTLLERSDALKLEVKARTPALTGTEGRRPENTPEAGRLENRMRVETKTQDDRK